MTTRFSIPEKRLAEGSRSAGGRRLSTSVPQLPTVNRGGIFGQLSKRTTIDGGDLARPGSSSDSRSGSKRSTTKNASQVQETSAADLKNARGKLCFICGAETIESGKQMRQCTECRSMQLASGLTSHAYAVKNPDELLPNGTTSRQASKSAAAAQKQFEADNPQDTGAGAALNPAAARAAWRRLSIAGHAEGNTVKDSGLPQTGDVADPDVRVPVMAGPFVNTGYYIGDRVKTTLRLPGACPSGTGWDPIQAQTDEGAVTGPGHNPGEIMVRFDAGGHICSMKMSHLAHVKVKEPQTNVARSACRKSVMTKMTTL